MQRRAAAAYVAFFLVVGAVSFSLIATASAPHFSVENPEHSLEEGESFTVNGTQYSVKSIEAEMSGGGGGGHGGGGGETLKRSGTLSWTNSSSSQTNEVTVKDKANVSLGSTTYFAYFPNNETMVLTQQFDQYKAHQQASADYKTHKDGLWGVTILSGIISFFMTGLAYLPSRY